MENYRRNIQNRLVKALPECGAVGIPCYALQLSVGYSDRASADTHWSSRSGRWDASSPTSGVHFTDMLRHLLGSVERVQAIMQQFEAERKIDGNFAFRPTPLRTDPVGTRAAVDASTAAVALPEFASGALGQLTI